MAGTYDPYGFNQVNTEVGAFGAANSAQAAGQQQAATMYANPYTYSNGYMGMTTPGAQYGGSVMPWAQQVAGYATSANPWLGQQSQQAAGVGTNAYAGQNNPYLQQQIDAASADATRHFNTSVMPGLDRAMQQSGSFGNTGIQAQQQQAYSDLGRNLGNISSGMRMQDYQQQQQMEEARLAREQQMAQFNAGLGAQDLSRNMQGFTAGQGLGLQGLMAQLQGAQFDAGQLGDLSKFNAGLFSSDLGRNAGLAAQQGQFNANAQQQAGQFNAQTGNQANQYWGGLGQQLNMFNTGQQNAANQYNAGQANNMLQNWYQRNWQGGQNDASRQQQQQQFDAGLDWNINQGNWDRTRQGSLDQLDMIKTLFGLNQGGVANANDQQNAGMNVLNQIVNMVNGIAGNGSTSSSSQTNQGNQVLTTAGLIQMLFGGQLMGILEDLAAQLRAQSPGSDWGIGGIDRAAELAQMLQGAGVTSLDGGLSLVPKDYTWSATDMGDNDLMRGFSEQRTGNALQIGGKTLGALGDQGRGDYYGNEWGILTDSHGSGADGRQEVGWSSKGDGAISYEVRPGPDGKLQIQPHWTSSSDANDIGETIVNGAAMVGGIYGAGAGLQSLGVGATGGAGGTAGGLGAAGSGGSGISLSAADIAAGVPGLTQAEVAALWPGISGEGLAGVAGAGGAAGGVGGSGFNAAMDSQAANAAGIGGGSGGAPGSVNLGSLGGGSTGATGMWDTILNGASNWASDPWNWAKTALALYGGHEAGKDQTVSQSQTREPWGAAQPALLSLLGQVMQMGNDRIANPLSAQQKTAYGNQAGLLDAANAMAPGLLAGMQANASGANSYDRRNPNKAITGAAYTGPQTWAPGLLSQYFKQGADVGILDLLNNENGIFGLGLLAAGAPQAQRQSLGGGILQAMAQANAFRDAKGRRAAEEEDRAMRRQQFDLSQQMHAFNLAQQQQAAARQREMDSLPLQFLRPGVRPETMDNRDVGQPGEQAVPAQQFDMPGYANAMYRYDPKTAMALQASLRKDTTPIKLGAGESLFDPHTLRPLAHNPKEADNPADWKLYQLSGAPQRGVFYDQWDLARRRAGSSSTTVSLGSPIQATLPNGENVFVQPANRPGEPPQILRMPGSSGEPLRPPASDKVREAQRENSVALAKVNAALAAVEAAPQAFGAQNYMGDPLMQRIDQSGVEARARVADISSLKIHDRSGAAVSAAEFPRLRPFVPLATDPPQNVAKKLRLFQQELSLIQQQLNTGASLSQVAQAGGQAAPAGDGWGIKLKGQ